jgi:rod shape-determining protein MreC
MLNREARAANYVLASFSIISLTLLSLPLSGPVQAFKATVTYLLTPVAYYGDKGAERFASVPGRLRDLMSADVENSQFKEQVKQAQWEKQEADSLKLENARLRAALGLKPRGGHQAVWAHVMERDPLRWYRSVTVDAGSEQGVTLNSPVLGHMGDRMAAIGRIVEVRPKNSVVLLVSDDLSSVAAYVVEPSTQTVGGEAPRQFEGLLQGQGSARLRMNYLSPDAEVKQGDLVYTSPTSATFPPDVLLGHVAKVNPLDPFLTFQSVEVQTALDPSRLKEVMILKQAPASAARMAETARAALGGEEPSVDDPSEEAAP